jgi:hypothetical protein
MRTLAGMVKGRSQGQAGANTETQPATVIKVYADAVGNVYAADVRGDGLSHRVLSKCPNGSGIRLWPGASVMIAWTRGSRFAPTIISTGSAESGSVLSSAQIGQDTLNDLNGDAGDAPDLSGVGFLLAGPDETVPDAYVLNPGANIYFEDLPAEQTSGGYQNAIRTILMRPLVLTSLPDAAETTLPDGTLADLVDSYGNPLGLYRLDRAAGVWRQRDNNAEVVAARTRDAVGRFAANTWASLKAHLAALWDAINLCTADPTGVTEGYVLTVNGSGGVEFAAPTGGDWAGAWSSAIAYSVGEEVSYQGSSWICIQAHTNQAPPTLPTESNSYWELRARKGDQGIQGIQGVQGNPGEEGEDGADGADLNPRGDWNSGSTYATRDYVYHEGLVYVALAASTNVEPGTDPTKWMIGGSNGTDGQGFDFLANWSSLTAYVPYDVVTYQGSMYVCLVGNTNVTPGTDPTKWHLTAQKGADGSSGSANPRDTVSVVSDSIANNVSDRTKNVELGKVTPILKVQASAPCWVVLYATDAHRTADAGRDVLTDPTDDHGVIGEWRFSADKLTWICAPIPFAANMEASPDENLAVAVLNESGVTQAITVTFTRLTIEP